VIPRRVASSFLGHCLDERLVLPTALAADLGCGRGRHIQSLLNLGLQIVAIDRDWAALREASAISSAVLPVVGDLKQDLPLRPQSIGLAVAVHVPLLPLVSGLPRILAPGGYVVLESVSGHGENWRELPKRGAIRQMLNDAFDEIVVKERGVGPASESAVTVRAFLRLR
jgi:SAM-dependent methyltransferase